MHKATLYVLSAVIAVAVAEGQFYVPRAYYTIDAEGHESLPVPLRRLRRDIAPASNPWDHTSDIARPSYPWDHSSKDGPKGAAGACTCPCYCPNAGSGKGAAGVGAWAGAGPVYYPLPGQNYGSTNPNLKQH